MSSLTRRTFVLGAAAGAFSGGLLAGCSVGTSGPTIEVTDMGGRVVEIPEAASRVFCTNPIGTVDIYALAPEHLVGWNFLPSGANQKYIVEEYLSLPSLGVWMGSGSTPNAEEIAAQAPDLLFCYWTADEAGCSMADEVAEQTGLPVLLVDYSIDATADMFRWVGTLLGEDERAEELATFCEEKLALIEEVAAAIPEAERKSIFLAQGTGGLSTDPVGSMHVTDALALINTENVADLPGTEGQGMGMPTVNLEQIITWDPSAVLVSEYSMSDSESSNIYDEIREDSHWLNIPCVAAGEIYRIPQAPFSWFGRPPSAVRLLGCLWLLKILYPDQAAALNIRTELEEFYLQFYNYSEFDDETLEALLAPAGIDYSTGQGLPNS